MRGIFTSCFLALGLVSAAGAEELSVELHTHLFMNEGMTWAFRGDFDGPLKVTSWKDRFSSQANPETLDQSGIGILVVSLYAHPVMTMDLRDSIRRQMELAERFVATHPNWIIARHPDEARAAIRSGKKVLVYSLEGASGVLDREEDLVEFVDRRGLRIVTFLHLTDDRYGGVAFMEGIKVLASPLAFLDQAFKPVYKDGVRVNARGLSELGGTLAAKLIKRKVWIDLAHSSDRAQEKLVPLLKAAGHPLLYTHTGLRRFRKAERAITDEHLEEVRKTDGIVGLVPSEEMLSTTPTKHVSCAEGCTRPQCEGGLSALAVQYAYAVGKVGAESVMFGSDFNGGMDHLRPTCGSQTTLDKGGLWHIGQTGEVWKALRRLRAPVPATLNTTVDRFLDAWAKVMR